VTIIKRPRARRDLVDHYSYLLQRNPEAAERFLIAAQEMFKRLSAMPEMGHLWLSPYERLKDIRVFPLIPVFTKYLVFYRPVKSGIEILHIFHSAQNILSVLEGEED
jgi:toxin ParE1/3/4